MRPAINIIGVTQQLLAGKVMIAEPNMPIIITQGYGMVMDFEL